ncbi:MAG: GDP-mannose 4,6-dehydratase [Bacteroidales bacterium]|nr:GDP-mannose 4,6-dehydratase [Bacteroidales bacterium]
MKILVTGSAGFIGAALVERLLDDPVILRRDSDEGSEPLSIVGVDNLNDYYDPALKEYRLRKIEEKYAACHSERSEESVEYQFIKGDIADREFIEALFAEHKFDIVVNLAAQAGVRYSIENPDVYVESNVLGFYNILEACRRSFVAAAPQDDRKGHDDSCHPERSEGSTYRGVQHLIYASSSSVYGSNKKVPFSVEDKVDDPVSLYAATKKSNELFASCYSRLYGIPCTGLRFFTVYGPAGRPDMAYFGFTDRLVRGQKIQIFNYGACERDFTYIDDIIEGIVRVMGRAPAGHALYNIGGGQPVKLLDFVQTLQEELVRAGVLPQDYDFDAHKELVPMQPGDVPVTYADASALERDFGFTPQVPLREGLRQFAEWYKEYYGL